MSKYIEPDKTAKVKTRLYTYEVFMSIQVLASNSDEADSLLDNQGGYVSTRRVRLVNDVDVFEEK
jgi:hypothetical protein